MSPFSFPDVPSHPDPTPGTGPSLNPYFVRPPNPLLDLVSDSKGVPKWNLDGKTRTYGG